MCTLVILRRVDSSWPVLLATNRDEMLDRPWLPPGHHWPDRPGIVAGRDQVAGGSWLGVNRTGVVAAILNRLGTLGPAPGMRSRGELVLDALDHADAAAAARALSALNASAYRPFNMVIVDNRDAFWLRSLGGTGHSGLRVEPVPEGLSMLTASEINDPGSARIRFHRPRFAAAPQPNPSTGDWTAWEKLLASHDSEPGAGAHGAMTIVTHETGGKRSGYGTCSSSLLALAAPGATAKRQLIWRFAPGAPDVTPYAPVTL